MMKRFCAFMLTAAVAVAAGAADKTPLRVLMIGNSFSLSVMRELPNIADAQSEYALDITSMYIGGCSLERHIREYETANEDPSHRPYKIDRYVTGKGRLKRVPGNLIDMLDARKYDIITIQEASPRSLEKNGWDQYGDKLVAIVREKQPQAKIVLHQTWSYRIDAPLLKKWKITQDEMFRRVRNIYADRAKHFDCGIIPMGEAVQIWRKKAPMSFRRIPGSKLKEYQRPKAPSYKGDVVGRHHWKKSKKTGEYKLMSDTNHLNRDGEYLQGCVWFAFLFGADAEKIAYKPKHLKPAEAALIRKCAAEAVAGK